MGKLNNPETKIEQDTKAMPPWLGRPCGAGKKWSREIKCYCGASHAKSHSHWTAGAPQPWPWGDTPTSGSKNLGKPLLGKWKRRETQKSCILSEEDGDSQSFTLCDSNGAEVTLRWEQAKALRALSLAESSTASMPCQDVLVIPRGQAGHRLPQEAVKSPSLEVCTSPLDQVLSSLVWHPFLLQKERFWQGHIHCELQSDSVL